MSKLMKFTVDDVDYSAYVSSLSFTKSIKNVGKWNAKLEQIKSFVGFETVKIYIDNYQKFQGRLENPTKEKTENSVDMPLSGPEWIARLNDYLTPHSDMGSVALTTALDTILSLSPFSRGTVDDVTESEVETKVWDGVLEFLPFTFSDSCIVYGSTVEVQDEPDNTLNMQLPPPNRRCCFYSKSSGYFYIVAYDATNLLLKYNSTDDFVSWKGWTSLGFNKGANGNYGVCWDEANGRLFLLCDDGANIDFYRYSEAAGTLTQQDNDDNVDAGDLLCGPIIDSGGDVFWICDDGANHVLWEFVYAASTWNSRDSRAKANTYIPKYMFIGDDAGDVIVVAWDDTNNDVEEWLWDSSGSSLAFVRKIEDINNDDCGYVSGFQSDDKNMFVVWEDEYAAGDADLYFSRRDIGATSWEDSVKIVDDDNYQSMSNFQLSGDEALNLYLFYVDDTGAARSIKIVRRFEETWDSAVALDSSNADASSQVRSPADGQALFYAFLDAGDDLQAGLMTAYGIGVAHTYSNPEEQHGFEGGIDFDNQWKDAGCIIEASTDWAATGAQSAKTYTPGSAGQKNAFGSYNTGGIHTVWFRCKMKVTQSGFVDNNESNNMVMFHNGTAGNKEVYFGWYKSAGALTWRLSLRQAGVMTNHSWGTPVVGTEYCVEIYWIQDGANGACIVYIDGTAVITVTSVDTDQGGSVSAIYIGQSANGLDNPTTAYFDDVAFTDVGRIGCASDGYFQTDTYTASAGMNEWGSLNSVNDDDDLTVWSVYDNVPALLVGGLHTAVDLEDAGVSNADTQIQIRCDMDDEELTGRNYVTNVHLGEKQGLVDVNVDYESVGVAVNKLANILGREIRLNSDDTLDVMTQLGEDKSATVILKTAKTNQHPEVKPNIFVLSDETDFVNFANAVKVLGSGDYPDRVEGEASDSDSQSTYGVHRISITNKDCVTVGMANTYALAEVYARKNPIERISVQFYDDYFPSQINEGDIVTLIDDDTGNDTTVRIMELTYSWDGRGWKASADLVSKAKGYTLTELLAGIKDLKRWI